MSKRAMVRARERSRARDGRRRRIALAAATAMGGAAIAAPGAQAAPFTVTNLDDTGPGSLRDAVDQANANPDADTIGFASGLRGTIAVGSEIQISEPVEIAGPGSDAITLDGGDADRILRAGTAGGVSVSGLALVDGDAAGNDGGAVYIAAGAAELDDVVVTGSTAFRGGGIFVRSDDIAITDSRVSGNSATFLGGGIATYGTTTPAPDEGVSIARSEISGNEARYNGGGIGLYDVNSDLVLDALSVTGNTVSGGAGSTYENGGGIWVEDVYNGYPVTLSNSTVSGNSVPDDGAGVAFAENFYGPATVVNTTIEGNQAGGAGGGLLFGDIDGGAEFALIDSTVTGNRAARGGGVFRGDTTGILTDSAVDVSSSVVEGNSASSGGTDFAVAATASGDLTIGNSLVGSVAGVAYSPDPAASNIIGVDPRLRDLRDNGGLTETMLPKPGSPLVDAGLANGLTGDQRGEPRTVEYPDVPNVNGSDGTDIGAAELDVLEGPFLSIRKPQLQKGKRIVVKIKAGADEDVRATATGVITIEKGNAVARTTFDTVMTGERATLSVEPKTGPAKRRIRRALTKDRLVTAEIRGKLKDASGNTYKRVLKAKLKLKK